MLEKRYNFPGFRLETYMAIFVISAVVLNGLLGKPAGQYFLSYQFMHSAWPVFQENKKKTKKKNEVISGSLVLSVDYYDRLELDIGLFVHPSLLLLVDDLRWIYCFWTVSVNILIFS